MRIPTFSRQTTADNTDADRTETVATHRENRPAQHDPRPPVSPRRDDTATTATIPAARTEVDRAAAVDRDRNTTGRATVNPTVADRTTDRPAPVPVADRKPRASMLATLGLILGVAGALLVLSGPLLGWGIGVAAVALVLSMAGLFATRKRHIAGKTDALIGLILSIGAIVVGILALAGQLSWLGTDMQPANDLRQWLDTQFETRF
ncbi:hypothetical protein OHA21_34020 [Actinoplanes sp. NBC_00393]|uniref:hypothetical protein n=1 Tax=Actinoplanes sp. NBC_00393 TaxID=2975953 RepID=UPI002E1BAB28